MTRPIASGTVARIAALWAGLACLLLVPAAALSARKPRPGADIVARTLVKSVGQARVGGSVFILSELRCRRRGCPLRLFRAPPGSSRFQRLPTPRATIQGPAFAAGEAYDVNGSVAGVFFVSKRVGWLAGRAVWFTTNGGRAWRRVPSPGGCRYTEIVGESRHRVFALGTQCSHGRQSVLFGARVGTTSFVPLLTPAAGVVSVSDFRVFVIRGDGVRYSTDDGATFGAPATVCGGPVFGDPVGDIYKIAPAQLTSAVWALCHEPNGDKYVDPPAYSQISPDGARPFVGRGKVPRDGAIFSAISTHTALLASVYGPLKRTIDSGTTYPTVVIPAAAHPRLPWANVAVMPNGRGLARRGVGSQTELWVSNNFGRSWRHLRPRSTL